MTLTDLIPTLRASLPHRLEPGRWPTSVRPDHGDLVVHGTSLVDLAGRVGTPAQVLDAADLRARARAEVAAFRRALPGVAVAHRAGDLLTVRVARRLAADGVALVVRTEAELTLAADAGFPMERVTADLGGTARSRLLDRAIDLGVARVVVDGPAGLAAVDSVVASTAGRPQAVLLAVAAAGGITGGTTGGTAGRGVPLAAAAARVRAARDLRGVHVTGLFCELPAGPGSAVAYADAAERLIGVLAATRGERTAPPAEIVFGGDPGVPAAQVAAALRGALAGGCERLVLAVPRVTVDRGRSISGTAVVTLARVAAVTRTPARIWVAPDVDLATRAGTRTPAVHLLGRLSGAPEEPVCLADPRTGPVPEPCPAATARVLLPADVRAGDLLAVAGVPAVPGGPLVVLDDENSDTQ